MQLTMIIGRVPLMITILTRTAKPPTIVIWPMPLPVAFFLRQQ